MGLPQVMGSGKGEEFNEFQASVLDEFLGFWSHHGDISVDEFSEAE